MKIEIKTYEYQKIEKSNTQFEVPEETSYYFETGIRRSIRIIPIWTTWNMKEYGLPEKIWEFHFTCVYGSWENKIETFKIRLSDFESLYNSEKVSIIKSLLNNDLDPRTKEQFENDLEHAIMKINEYEDKTIT